MYQLGFGSKRFATGSRRRLALTLVRSCTTPTDTERALEHHLDDLPLRVLLDEAADAYETLIALPLPAGDSGDLRSGTPRSKVPPGMGAILDAEERERTIGAVDDWATYLTRHLVDVTPGAGAVSPSASGRLRFAASWADKLEEEPDPFARYAFRFDAVENLRAMRRLIRRGNRVVRTGSSCLDVTCRGQYEAVIDGPEIDGDLVCSGCGGRVTHDQWSRWGSQAEWVTVAHAANMLGVPVSTVRVWAHRYGWDREGTGRGVRYRAEDVKEKRGIVKSERGRGVSTPPARSNTRAPA